MKNGKISRQDGTSAKRDYYRLLPLFLAFVLLVGGAVGGTVAWLIANTDPVVNTFTYGDINLKLEETEVDENGDLVKDSEGNPVKTTEGNDYEMIPGEEYLKDPAVTVLAGNEACWLFVKLEENGGATITNADGSTTTYVFDDYLDYEVILADPANNIEGWTRLVDAEGDEVEGVYFRYVGEDTDNAEVTYEVLKDNQISVQDTVTKEMLNALDNNGADTATATYPSLSVTAYAVQYSGFEAEVSDGATESTAEQLNTAALSAWEAVEEQNATANP